MRFRGWSAVDQRWLGTKIAYLVDGSVTAADVEREAAPLRAITPGRSLHLSHIRVEDGGLQAKTLQECREQPPGAYLTVITAAERFTVVVDHLLGDSSFSHAAIRLLLSAKQQPAMGKRLGASDLLALAVRSLLADPRAALPTLRRTMTDRRSMRGRGSFNRADSKAHAHFVLDAATLARWKANRVPGESGRAGVMRRIAQTIHEAAPLPEDAIVRVMVDLRRYDARYSHRIGNLVGAVVLPLATTLQDPPTFGRELALRLRVAQPAITSAVGILLARRKPGSTRRYRRPGLST